ncbi:hypothetical protein SAMN04488591_1845 [Microbacterium azadirachtae]|uniref:Uncharacterized protein n=1 Tax=Microbacterium azadirachtae TaxID=582680 RepID=A0A1I6HHU0_9MICO|nr:hypothetical protein SAMN04488591_1845 [Microbacterium azadirachtae]
MSNSTNDRQERYSFVLAPPPGQEMTVLFEPGAGEYVLMPGHSFRIAIFGSEDDRLELTHGPGYVTLWPSGGMHLEVIDERGRPVPLLGH